MLRRRSKDLFLAEKCTLPLLGRIQRVSTHLYSRGVGLFGALGVNEDLADRPEFTEVLIPDPSESIKAVSAGWAHSTALTESGRLYAWGRLIDFPTLMRLNRLYSFSNTLGRLVARSSNFVFGDAPAYYPFPVLIHDESIVKSVSCSAGLTLYLDEDGKVFSFGQNKFIQCGIDTKRIQHIHHPVCISSLPPALKVEAGLQHGVALSTSGEVFTWGKTDKGRLGVPFNSKAEFGLEPSRVSLKDINGKGLHATDICAGFAHTAAIAEDGAVYLWGKGMSLTEEENRKSECQCAPTSDFFLISFGK